MLLSEISNFNDKRDMQYITRYRYQRLRPTYTPAINRISYYDRKGLSVKFIALTGLTLIWNNIFNPEKPKPLRCINGSYHYGYSYEGEEDEEDYDEW